MSDNGPQLPPPSDSTRSASENAPTSAEPTSAEPKKPWWQRWWAITLGILVVLIVIAGIFGGDDDEDNAADERSAVSTTIEAAVTTEETAAVQTTEPTPETTSAPETTEAPTTTAEPTTTPAPTTTLPPEPIAYEGSGDSVQQIEFPNGAQLGIITLSHSGSSNFAVWSLDADLQQQALLVNEIGAYQGTVLDARGAVALEISADGPWRVETNTVQSAPPFDPDAIGRGDSVILYTGQTGVATVTHTGESNFAVWSYLLSSGDPDLLVNEIGPYSGTIRFPGPSLVEISADGDWSIAIS